MTEEIFDVCDAEDHVIGQAPRSVVHRDKLLHRAVHVFVFNSQEELLVQVRSVTKDEFPLCYTSSASGHLCTGEDYLEAAQRELEEEIGLVAPLEFMGKFSASEEFAWEHTVLYRVRSDQEPRPDPVEISAMLRFSMPDLLQHLTEQPAKFSPPFRKLVEWHAKTNP
ncbi:MAG: Nudix hydrolase [Planctomycetaceae bacterium]|nr:Nudix hydrolase [Planctomycetaceae bacterium]